MWKLAYLLCSSYLFPTATLTVLLFCRFIRLGYPIMFFRQWPSFFFFFTKHSCKIVFNLLCTLVTEFTIVIKYSNRMQPRAHSAFMHVCNTDKTQFIFSLLLFLLYVLFYFVVILLKLTWLKWINYSVTSNIKRFFFFFFKSLNTRNSLYLYYNGLLFTPVETLALYMI